MLQSKNFLSGLLMMAFGLGAIWQAQSYRLGTLIQMGPGYFPILVGSGLAIVGLCLIAGSIKDPASQSRVDPIGFRALLLPLAAIVVFGLLIQPLGLVLALAALVGITALASRDFRPLEVAAMIVVIGAIVVTIFVLGLSLPIKVWPV